MLKRVAGLYRPDPEAPDEARPPTAAVGDGPPDFFYDAVPYDCQASGATRAGTLVA